QKSKKQKGYEMGLISWGLRPELLMVPGLRPSTDKWKIDVEEGPLASAFWPGLPGVPALRASKQDKNNDDLRGLRTRGLPPPPPDPGASHCGGFPAVGGLT